MTKIPKNAKKEVPQKCKICGLKFKSKEYLVYHIEKTHEEDIPEDWSASRYENYLRTGKTSGNCVVCKKETEWNESTWKYARLCKDPKCRKSISKEADKNMIGKYGKTTLLNDPEQQRKMIYSKKTSGIYYWSTDTSKKYPMRYASSVEYKFLEMLDVFLNLEPEDVMSPSPNNYTYKYEGKDHLYIPDVYIVSLNLEVELKEPSDNQNMHPKIQAVDKVKERLKDELMDSIKFVNYVKVNGTDYSNFFAAMAELKNVADNRKTDTAEVLESVNNIELDDVVTEKTDGLEFINIASSIRYSVKDIVEPGLNFDTTVHEFETQVNTCTSLANAKIIKKNLSSYKKYLKKISSDAGNGISPRDAIKHSDMKYSAKESLDKINTIEDKLELKMRSLRKSGGESHFATEGYVDGWYQTTESQITGYKRNVLYRPVFIFLSYTGSSMAKIIKAVTNGTFSHASISLDTGMRNMFSFNRSGFVDEDINSGEFEQVDDAYYSVYMYLATQTEYDTIQSMINNFINNRSKFRYSIRGLFNYIANIKSTYTDEWFCSEFVSYVLSEANPKLFSKHYSLYSPDDLSKTKKFIKVYTGKLATYDEDTIDRNVRKILNRKEFDYVDTSHR